VSVLDRLRSWVALGVRAGFARVVLRRLNDRGATATEYALLVGLIAMVIVAGVTFFGQNLNGWFHRLGLAVAPFSS
jgi:pilus assembly protein Flp/PilA